MSSNITASKSENPDITKNQEKLNIYNKIIMMCSEEIYKINSKIVDCNNMDDILKFEAEKKSINTIIDSATEACTSCLKLNEKHKV